MEKTMEITLGDLRTIIQEEKKKLSKSGKKKNKEKESDASDLKELEHPVDWMKKLDIKESFLRKELWKVREQKRRLIKVSEDLSEDS